MSRHGTLLAEAQSIMVEAQARVFDVLPELAFEVAVEHAPEQTIPELGISGRFTKEKGLIEIWIDEENPHLRDNLDEEVTRTFAHEYMHGFREQHIPWEGGTLLMSLVSEGLSQCFEMEIWPDAKPPIYASQLSEVEILASWQKALPLLDEIGIEDAWLFGAEESGLKRWTGYSLGFWLVQNHMRRTGKKASELGQEQAAAFLP